MATISAQLGTTLWKVHRANHKRWGRYEDSAAPADSGSADPPRVIFVFPHPFAQPQNHADEGERWLSPESTAATTMTMR